MFKTTNLPKYKEIDVVLNPWKLRSLLKKLNPTHVHLSVEGPLGITARLLLSKWKWRYTTAYHTNFPEYIETHIGLSKRFIIPLVRWFHKNSSAVLTPSKSTSDKLNEWRIPNSIVWGRGFNKEIFHPSTARGFKPKSDKKNLLYVGRVSDEKNIEEFLKLQTDHRRLVVVGDGPARQKLEKKYPLAEFVGFKQDAALARYYQEADVFVFPSKSDTLGVVMIESIACGTPVAAYNVEGPLDVVSPSINGYLSDNLEEAVQNAITLDRNMVVWSSRKFTWESSADTFEQSLVTIK